MLRRILTGSIAAPYDSSLRHAWSSLLLVASSAASSVAVVLVR